MKLNRSHSRLLPMAFLVLAQVGCVGHSGTSGTPGITSLNCVPEIQQLANVGSQLPATYLMIESPHSMRICVIVRFAEDAAEVLPFLNVIESHQGADSFNKLIPEVMLKGNSLTFDASDSCWIGEIRSKSTQRPYSVYAAKSSKSKMLYFEYRRNK